MKHVFMVLMVTLLVGAAYAQTPPPSGLAADHDGTGTVTLTWNAPAVANGAGSPADLIEWPETDAERFGWDPPNYQELKAQWNEMNQVDELDDFIEYRIYRNFALIASTTNETFIDDLPQAGSFTYEVTAFYDEGESTPSNEVTVVFYDPDNYVLNETFDDGLPETWSVEGHGATMTWHVDNGNERGLFPTPYMLVDSDEPGSCPHLQERLITPELDGSGATIVELSFIHTFNEYAEEHGFIEVRVDGGAWQTYEDFSGDITESSEVIDISEDALDNMFEVSFYYDDLGNWGWYWGVDNVQVYLGTPGSPVILDLVPQQTVIPAEGGNLVFDVSLESSIGASYNGLTFWTEVELPNGQVFGPLITQNFNLTPFMDAYVPGLSQPIPLLAPPGDYAYRGLAGYFPNPSLGDELSFIKQEAQAPVAGAFEFDPAEWTPSGDLSALSGEPVVAASELPAEFELGAAYPNPFNPTATVSVSLPQAADLSVAVFNVMGQQVAELANGEFAAGKHAFVIDGNHLASGVYFIQATVPGELDAVQKITLMK